MKSRCNSIDRNSAAVRFRLLACSIRMGSLPLGMLLGFGAVLHAQLPVAQPAIASSSARAVPKAMSDAAPASFRPAAPQEPSAATRSPGARKPGDEGIKVHGYWVIDVRNPDGTLAHHTEFENSLQPGGADFILGLIAGAYSSGDLAIAINGSPGPCNGGGCLIVKAIGVNPASLFCGGIYLQCPTTLVTTFNSLSSSATTSSLVLTGNVTAFQNGSINQVQTYFSVCGYGNTAQSSETVAPSACPVAALQSNPLTSAVPPAITTTPVVAGQIIQVTVTITLS